MDKEKLIKFLVPVVAVLVIIESVVLVNGAVKKKSELGVNPAVEKIPAEAEVRLEAAGTSMAVGEKIKMTLRLSTAKMYAFDAIESYVNYDVGAFEVDNLVFENDLPQPTISKISRDKGMIIVSYLIDEPAGYKLEAGSGVTLVSFEVTAKKSGSYDFEIATGPTADGSVTMLVESVTSKAIPFEVNGVRINVL